MVNDQNMHVQSNCSLLLSLAVQMQRFPANIGSSNYIWNSMNIAVLLSLTEHAHSISIFSVFPFRIADLSSHFSSLFLKLPYIFCPKWVQNILCMFKCKYDFFLFRFDSLPLLHEMFIFIIGKIDKIYSRIGTRFQLLSNRETVSEKWNRIEHSTQFHNHPEQQTM